MKVSVVIPSYNRAELLPRALKSVFLQSWLIAGNEIEVLLIDDGSIDDTAAVIREQFPGVRYFYQPNSGVSVARNLGIKLASGDWIAFLDSDDEWMPHKLDEQLKYLQDSGLSVCHTGEIWIRHGKRVNQMKKHRKHGGRIFEHCLPLCTLSPSSVLVHRDVFDAVGLFDETLPACEDYDLWLRICAVYPVAYVEQPCIHKFGGHADQLSRRFWGMDRFRVKALEKILDTGLSAEQYSAAHAMLLRKIRILLNGAIKHGNQALERDCYAKLQQWTSDSGTIDCESV